MGSKDKRIEKNKTLHASFYHAFQGFVTVFKEERNMKVHVLAGVCAVIAGLLFKLTASEWLWIALAIFVVIIIEVINTSLENMVDLATGCTYHPLGKKVKDMAATAVLISAVFALVVGGIIFLPKVMHLWK